MAETMSQQRIMKAIQEAEAVAQTIDSLAARTASAVVRLRQQLAPTAQQQRPPPAKQRVPLPMPIATPPKSQASHLVEVPKARLARPSQALRPISLHRYFQAAAEEHADQLPWKRQRQ